MLHVACCMLLVDSYLVVHYFVNADIIRSIPVVVTKNH